MVGTPPPQEKMTAKTIFIVEDDPDILELLEFNLTKERFRCICHPTGLGAVRAIKAALPDMVLLDLMLPDIDGMEIIKRLKADSSTASIPVIMVTAKGSEVDRIVGFELGADDYVVKPFSPRELILRVKAIFSRLERAEERGTKEIVAGPLRIVPEHHLVEVEGERIDLTAMEFKLLYDMANSPGVVKTREVLLNRVWGYEFDGYGRTVDTHIRRLRKKLGPAAPAIETIRGVGYRFDPSRLGS